MTILVITPTLGRSPHFAESVASVSSARGDFRHVVVCPSAQAKRLRLQYPNLEVIEDEGRGVYAAINRGLEVGGRWQAWTWLNDDDRWRPEGVDLAIETLAADDAVDVVYGRVAYVGYTGAHLGYLPVARNPEQLRNLMSAGLVPITQQGTFVRRRAWEKIGMLDTRYRLAADFAWWARGVSRGLAFRFIDAHVADFRIRGGQLSQSVGEMREEVRSIIATEFGGRRSARAMLDKWCFRAGRGREILRRYRVTGCWRTSTLLRRFGSDHS